MVYSLVTLILVLATCLIFLPKFRNLVERQSLAINFFLTLIATLVGVLLAIAISNYEQEVKEKEDVSKLIRASIHSVETCFEYSQALVSHFDNLADKDSKKVSFFVNNPLPYPDYIDVFVMQNIVSKNLSQVALSDLNELIINLKRSSTSKPSVYLTMLDRTKQLLETELLYQVGDIDYQELEQQLDVIEQGAL